ncbi:MAG: double-strand break repair protein AddB [Bdellovibrionales bacterium]
MKNVSTIPSDLCFVSALASYLWRRVEGNPLKLAEMTVYLPTRRACRNLRTAFLRITEARAALLPRMRPLGDVDEEELGFAVGMEEGDIAPAISPLRRLMLLVRLIQRKETDLPFSLLLSLAQNLAALLDHMQTQEKSFNSFHDLVPLHEGAQHWQETLAFLEVITKAWPDVLAEEGAIDPAKRRRMVIDELIGSWQETPPQGPVIAAGSTGSVPAVGRLMAKIAQLPEGQVILPGLDLSLDEESWQEIDETHPQYTMKHWLSCAGVERSDVSYLEGAMPQAIARLRLLQEAMRPAQLTDSWRDLTMQDIPEDSFRGLEKIECDHHREEADVIALRLRAALEEQGQTIALVTPDRALARRVISQLQRWGIVANDSAGEPLDHTPLGGFLLQILKASSGTASPIDILALLKHPLLRMKRERIEALSLARRIEKLVFRGVRPAGGFETLVRLVHEAGDEDAGFWLSQIADVLAPLREAETREFLLEEHTEAHLQAAESLAANPDKTGAQTLWRGDEGEAAVSFFNEWKDNVSDFPPVLLSGYRDLCEGLMKGQMVRPQYGVHPRLSILGPLEARLAHHDLIILGGLNEKTWPPAPSIDPWLSRPMKQELGLPTPEQRIGLSAHDFVSLAAAPCVVLTRARRVGRVPTVPSRFLLQLRAVLESVGHHDLNSVDPWRDWAAMAERPRLNKPMEAPLPCPPVAARPTHLSVTEIGTWVANPYGIYAKRILKLRKLDDIDADVGAADKGDAIHQALEVFIKASLHEWPDDPLAVLLEKGRKAFAPFKDKPQIEAFWWPRFEHMATRFVAREARRRAVGYKAAYIEESGVLQITDRFSLNGKVDRIDYTPLGKAQIIDYKTGVVPSLSMVRAGFEPQLPLLALMAFEGAFDGGEIMESACLSYWEIKGARTQDKEVDFEEEEIIILVQKAQDNLRQLIKEFEQETTPYRASPTPQYIPRYDDYRHLARYDEWSSADEGGDE